MKKQLSNYCVIFWLAEAPSLESQDKSLEGGVYTIADKWVYIFKDLNLWISPQSPIFFSILTLRGDQRIDLAVNTFNPKESEENTYLWV